MKKKTLTLVGYCRVSTDNQKKEGTIKIQEQALKEYAEQDGYKLIKIFKDDGVSGSLENRPGLAALFDYIEDNTNIDGVLIFKLDRLARDIYIQEHLFKKLGKLNLTLISTKEPDLDSKDPGRKAFRQFMGVVSELEKGFITMRLSGGRTNKARKGKYAGGFKAYGYKVKDNDLQLDPEQSQVIKKIFIMKRNGHKSLRQIAEYLNKAQIPTARGGKWYAGTVKYILDNKLYKGQYEYSGEQAKRGDLAII